MRLVPNERDQRALFSFNYTKVYRLESICIEYMNWKRSSPDPAMLRNLIMCCQPPELRDKFGC